MRRTLHFVYAVPHAPHRPRRALYRARRALGRRLGEGWQPWRRGRLHFEERPALALRQPYTITLNVLAHLQRSYAVRLYDWEEVGVPLSYGPEDIILGHPNPKPDRVMNRMLADARPAAAKIAIAPFAHAIGHADWLLPHLQRCDAYAAICGRYWLDTLGTSIFKELAPVFTRVDLAVELRLFPYLKTRFNAAGQRRFLYIGHSGNRYKGCEHLSALALALSEWEFAWIGSGPELPGVRHLAADRALTPAFMREVCREYDFFITMGVSDANPTTILEAMAWGLPIVCTPQSGYYNMETIFNVSLDDLEQSVAVLRRLQALDEAALHAVSRANRELVAREYTWERFNRSVDAAIDAGLARRAAAGER